MAVVVFAMKTRSQKLTCFHGNKKSCRQSSSKVKKNAGQNEISLILAFSHINSNTLSMRMTESIFLVFITY